MSIGFLDLDQASAGHLLVALQLLRPWLRERGLPAPPTTIDDLEEALKCATRRQETTKLAAAAVGADPPGMAPIGLTYDEAAKVLGVSRRTIDRLVSSGELDAIELGSSRRIHREDLERFADSRRRRRAPDRPGAVVPPNVRFKSGEGVA